MPAGDLSELHGPPTTCPDFPPPDLSGGPAEGTPQPDVFLYAIGSDDPFELQGTAGGVLELVRCAEEQGQDFAEVNPGVWIRCDLVQAVVVARP